MINSNEGPFRHCKRQKGSPMKTQHTPGPWEPHIYESGGFEIVSAHERKFIITSRNGYQEWDRGNESIDNAHLIAAAPELLEALEAAVSWIEDDRCDDEYIAEEWYHEARSAIAKARGEQ